MDATYSNMYKGIRQCYLLKKNIASVPGLSDDKINDFANQADFLIAYYHSVLMQHYGPIILVKELPDMNTPYDKMAARSPYDECVDWGIRTIQNRIGEIAYGTYGIFLRTGN